MRFEVVGASWGVFETSESVDLVNISEGGLLIASRREVALGGMETVELCLGRRTITVDVIVRHVTPRNESGGTREWLVGLAFVEPSRWLLEAIGQPVDDAIE